MIDDIIKKYILKIEPTGSNYICNPPVTDTDKDYLILPVEGEFDNLIVSLQDDDWEAPHKGYEDSNFISLKKRLGATLINLIIIRSEVEFDAYVYATKIAKELNLREKDDRIKLFEIVKRTYPIRNTSIQTQIDDTDPFANYRTTNNEG